MTGSVQISRTLCKLNELRAIAKEDSGYFAGGKVAYFNVGLPTAAIQTVSVEYVQADEFYRASIFKGIVPTALQKRITEHQFKTADECREYVVGIANRINEFLEEIK